MTNAQMAHKMGLDKFTGYVEDCDSLAKILKTMGFKVEEDDRRVFDAVIIDSCDNTLTVHFGNDMDNLITARIDKINGTHKWYYGKTVKQILAAVRQCMEPYTFPEPETEEEEETMNTTTTNTVTYHGKQVPIYGGAWNDSMNSCFYDVIGSVKGYDICRSTADGTIFALSNPMAEDEKEDNTTTNNKEEEATMKTTTSNPITLDLVGGIVRFELNDTTYTYNIETKRYAKITPDGKTKRIGKAEYDEAKASYDQQVLDDQPSRVEVENDLEKPAVLNEYGCVDCSKCNCDKCVHRDCMRRNPRNVGGLGECPRLDNGIVSEAQKVAEETGMELAEAELAVNVQNEQKKPRKARKSKDIAYEGHGKTLTAKQVDFILHLSDTCFWENGLDSTPWIDVLCDEIGGQFADKPMTVGAMVSTLCEKGLGYRATDSLTDMATGRSHKATYFALTDLGKEIAAELGLE